MLSDHCLPVCNVGVLWPNGCMDQDEIWHGGRPQPRPHGVTWGPSFPPQKGHSPQFSAHVCCGQTAEWIKMPLGMKVGLGPGDVVLDGTQMPPKKGHSPQFSEHVYCGQTAGWIKMPRGTKVCLSPAGHTVSDGGPSSPNLPPPKKKVNRLSRNFCPCLFWSNGWMDEDAHLVRR